MSPVRGLSVLLLAGCASAPAVSTDPRPAGPTPPPPAPDVLEIATALSGPDADAAQRALREAVAAGGERGAAAALVLVNHYALREALADAIAIVDAALAASGPLRELRLARAHVLRDLDRQEEAAAVLEDLLAADPADARARILLAEIEFARGDDGAAEIHVEALLGPLADREDAQAVRARVETLRLRLQEVAAGQPRPRSAGELLAKLRGSPDAELRHAALAALLASPEVRPRALAAARLHHDPLLRVAAVRALTVADAGHAEHVALALEDADPRVRGAAAAAVARLELDPDSTLRRLLAEEDPYVFRLLHETLGARTGITVELAPGTEQNADGRERTRQAWRRHWNP